MIDFILAAVIGAATVYACPIMLHVSMVPVVIYRTLRLLVTPLSVAFVAFVAFSNYQGLYKMTRYETSVLAIATIAFAVINIVIWLVVKSKKDE